MLFIVSQSIKYLRRKHELAFNFVTLFVISGSLNLLYFFLRDLLAWFSSCFDPKLTKYNTGRRWKEGFCGGFYILLRVSYLMRNADTGINHDHTSLCSFYPDRRSTSKLVKTKAAAQAQDRTGK
jgi:hypothetical protein